MKKINVDGHSSQCKICFEMARRGYKSEAKYWEDFFAKKDKPVKYILYYKGERVLLKDVYDQR